MKESRARLIHFDEIRLGSQCRYLIKDLLPSSGLALIWGPPKCGKSFLVFDMMMHVALGRSYRGRRVQPGPVVYCAFEGQSGIEARAQAYRLRKLSEHPEPVPFYLQPVKLDLIAEHAGLIEEIRKTLPNTPPVAVVLDTLNRSFHGSESSDQDMTAYVSAADAIREAFDCAVIIVHHCGLEGGRPRGHSSLTGAIDSQISVTRRPGSNLIIAECELSKDGQAGDAFASRLEVVAVGQDEDGDNITSCVIVEADAEAQSDETGSELSHAQRTMLKILTEAGELGLTTEDLNKRARRSGIGVNRPATLTETRNALEAKALIRSANGAWITA